MDWLPIGMIALLTSTFIVSIAYMIARGFHLPALEAWAKLQYQEVIITAIILGGVVFGLAFIDVVAGQLGQGIVINFDNPASSDPNNYVATCSPSASANLDGTYQFAKCYLDGSADYLLAVYERFVAANRYAAKLTTFFFNIAIPLWIATASVSKAPYAGLSVLNSMMGSGQDAIASSIFIQLAQKVLLQFFHERLFVWFLSIGIVLRTFSFSRKVGATLIAIAIGTYMVYPLSIAFAAGVYNEGMTNINIVLPNEPPDLQDTAICSPFVQIFMQPGSIIWWLVWFSIPCASATVGWWACMKAAYPAAQSIYNAINSAFLVVYAPTIWDYAKISPNDVFNSLANSGLLEAAAHNAMIVAVLAVFSTIITVSTTRALSIQLGGDAEFYGIYKLI